MSSQMITVCQTCWKMTNHKTNPTLINQTNEKKTKVINRFAKFVTKSDHRYSLKIMVNGFLLDPVLLMFLANLKCVIRRGNV